MSLLYEFTVEPKKSNFVGSCVLIKDSLSNFRKKLLKVTSCFGLRVGFSFYKRKKNIIQSKSLY
jgi:hypothetical protein